MSPSEQTFFGVLKFFFFSSRIKFSFRSVPLIIFFSVFFVCYIMSGICLFRTDYIFTTYRLSSTCCVRPTQIVLVSTHSSFKKCVRRISVCWSNPSLVISMLNIVRKRKTGISTVGNRFLSSVIWIYFSVTVFKLCLYTTHSYQFKRTTLKRL